MIAATSTDCRLWCIIDKQEEILAFHIPDSTRDKRGYVREDMEAPNSFFVSNPVSITTTSVEKEHNRYNKTPDEVWIASSDGSVTIFRSGKVVHSDEENELIRGDSMKSRTRGYTFTGYMSIDSTIDLNSSKCMVLKSIESNIEGKSSHNNYNVKLTRNKETTTLAKKMYTDDKNENPALNPNYNENRKIPPNVSVNVTTKQKWKEPNPSQIQNNTMCFWRTDMLPVSHTPGCSQEHGLIWRVTAPGRLALYRKGGILVKQFMVMNERKHLVNIFGVHARGNHLFLYSTHHIYIMRIKYTSGSTGNKISSEFLNRELRRITISNTISVLYSRHPITSITVSPIGQIYEIWALCYDIPIVWRYSSMQKHTTQQGRAFHYDCSFSIPAMYNIIYGDEIGPYQKEDLTTKNEGIKNEIHKSPEKKRIINNINSIIVSSPLVSKPSNLDLAFAKAYSISLNKIRDTTKYYELNDRKTKNNKTEGEIMNVQKIPSPLLVTPPYKIEKIPVVSSRSKSANKSSKNSNNYNTRHKKVGNSDHNYFKNGVDKDYRREMTEMEKLMELERIRKEIRSEKAANFGLSSIPPNVVIRPREPNIYSPNLRRNYNIPSLDIIDYDSEDPKDNSNNITDIEDYTAILMEDK